MFVNRPISCAADLISDRDYLCSFGFGEAALIGAGIGALGGGIEAATGHGKFLPDVLGGAIGGGLTGGIGAGLGGTLGGIGAGALGGFAGGEANSLISTGKGSLTAGLFGAAGGGLTGALGGFPSGPAFGGGGPAAPSLAADSALASGAPGAVPGGALDVDPNTGNILFGGNPQTAAGAGTIEGSGTSGFNGSATGIDNAGIPGGVAPQGAQPGALPASVTGGSQVARLPVAQNGNVILPGQPNAGGQPQYLPNGNVALPGGAPAAGVAPGQTTGAAFKSFLDHPSLSGGGDLLKTAFSNNPGGFASAGLLGVNALRSSSIPGADQLKAQAAAMQAQAGQLTQALNGQLPAGASNALKAASASAKAALRSQLAASGISDSTMLGMGEAAIDASMAQETFKIADTLVGQGVQLSQVSAQTWEAIMNSQTQQNSALMQSIATFATGFVPTKPGQQA